jgi:hypothetical protein
MADEVMKASVELDGVVPELWSAAFYPTLLETLPFNDSISRDYEGEIQALGDTVNINSFPQFELAQEINEDEKADADSVTVSKQQLVINKQVVKDFILTKKAIRQSIDSQNALRDLALHSILKKMQQIIIAETVPNASAPDHSIAYDSGTTLALADILEAKELLDNQDVPDNGSRVMILGAAQWNDLFNITGFTSRDFIPAGSPLVSGQIVTPILGFRPRMTTEVSSTAYLFHPMYQTMAVQQSPDVAVYDLGGEGKRAMRVNMDVLFGVKQLDGLRVVTIS